MVTTGTDKVAGTWTYCRGLLGLLNSALPRPEGDGSGVGVGENLHIGAPSGQGFGH